MRFEGREERMMTRLYFCSFSSTELLLSPNDHYLSLQRWSFNSIFPHLLSFDFLPWDPWVGPFVFIRSKELNEKKGNTKHRAKSSPSAFVVQVDTCMMHNSFSFCFWVLGSFRARHRSFISFFPREHEKSDAKSFPWSESTTGSDHCLVLVGTREGVGVRSGW